MTMTAPVDALCPHALLASPATRRLLTRFVARRVPACDVDDVVQATLCDAIASGRAPGQAEDLRRFLLAIARFKVVDAHRAACRTTAMEAEPSAAAPPVEAMSLLRWAERQLPRGTETTLRWMLREAEGDKLETIAADEAMPAERVRQRVSRLRRWMRERWLLELAAVAALLLVAGSALRTPRYEVILPEAAFAGSAIDARLVGSWRLVDYRPAGKLPEVRRALADRVGPSLIAHFDGRTLRASAVEASFTRTYVAARANGGAIEAVEASAGARALATYAWDGDDLVLTVPTGAWAGVARFRRR